MDPFEIVATKNFAEELKTLIQTDNSLKGKAKRAIERLKLEPFAGKKIEAADLEQRRIWVGTNYRLFYDIDGNKIILLSIRKKNVATYRR